MTAQLGIHTPHSLRSLVMRHDIRTQKTMTKLLNTVGITLHDQRPSELEYHVVYLARRLDDHQLHVILTMLSHHQQFLINTYLVTRQQHETTSNEQLNLVANDNNESNDEELNLVANNASTTSTLTSSTSTVTAASSPPSIRITRLAQ